MPKSKHRRTGKSRPASKRATRPNSTPQQNRLYAQPCPDEALINEFGEEGVEWLMTEYGRSLNLADLELEKAIKADRFTMDHPVDGATEYTLAELSTTLWTLIQVVLDEGRRQGVMTESELEETSGGGVVDHSEGGPGLIRNGHWAGWLFLNQRGMWDFGEPS